MTRSPEFRLDPETHTYWLGERKLPGTTEILDACGLISEFSKNEAAALRGNYAHTAAKFLFEGRLDWSTVGLPIMGFVVSLDRWLESTGFQPEQCEVSGYHPFFLYGGTWDVIGIIPKRGRYLLDLKTGVSAKWHCYQSAAYTGIAGRDLKRGSLYLQKSGAIARFAPHEDPDDWAKFISARNVYEMQQEAA